MLEKLKSRKELIIIVAIVILIMIPLMSHNYIAGDDTQYHMSNIFSRYTQMSEGNIFASKVLPIIARDFGYGSGIFYPAMSHTSVALLTLLFAGNVALSLKFIHFIVYLISAIMMYKLTLTVFKNKFVALLSSIFYISFPYSITEVFRRDALAESFIFMFMPMIILALYELFYGNKKKFYLWFVIGYVGLINSHLVLAVYFTILIMIYLILNIKKVFTKENIKSLVISSIIILLIVSPFIIPMLEHKALKIYEVFEGQSMANVETTVNSAMTLDEFIVQETSKKFTSINYYMNLLALGMVVITIILNKKIISDKIEKNFFKFLIILTIITTFLLSNLCPWRFAPKFMIMIQFAWRLETILILALSILAALSTRNIKNRKIKIIVLMIVLLFNGYTVYKTYDFKKIVPMDIKNIDISYWGMGWEKEYLPTATKNNIEYFDNRTQDIIIEKGNANILVEENNTPYLKAKIENITEETTIELPRLYYLGYNLNLIDKDGKKEKLQYNMSANGFIETKVNQDGEIELKYTGTTANKIANVISILTIIISVIMYIKFIKHEN